MLSLAMWLFCNEILADSVCWGLIKTCAGGLAHSCCSSWLREAHALIPNGSRWGGKRRKDSDPAHRLESSLKEAILDWVSPAVITDVWERKKCLLLNATEIVCLLFTEKGLIYNLLYLTSYFISYPLILWTHISLY